MASTLEIRDRQMQHLTSLLLIKRNNENTVVRLDEELLRAIISMEQEDVAYVEKLVGVTAI